MRPAAVVLVIAALLMLFSFPAFGADGDLTPMVPLTWVIGIAIPIAAIGIGLISSMRKVAAEQSETRTEVRTLQRDVAPLAGLVSTIAVAGVRLEALERRCDALHDEITRLRDARHELQRQVATLESRGRPVHPDPQRSP